jgi:hypothetical protein
MWADAHMTDIQEAMMCLAFAHIPIHDEHDNHSTNGYHNNNNGNNDDDDDDTGVADMKEGRDGKTSDEKLPTPPASSTSSPSPSPPATSSSGGHVSRSTSATPLSSSSVSPHRTGSTSGSSMRRPSITHTPVLAAIPSSPRRSPLLQSNGNGVATNGNGHTNGHHHHHSTHHSNGVNGHMSPNSMASTSGRSDSTPMAKYRRYMSSDRWNELTHLFKADLYALNGLPARSLLSIHLQAGLSALKTPYAIYTMSHHAIFDDMLCRIVRFCGCESDHNDECPVCSPTVTALVCSQQLLLSSLSIVLLRHFIDV